MWRLYAFQNKTTIGSKACRMFGQLQIGALGTNLNEVFMEIKNISFREK